MRMCTNRKMLKTLKMLKQKDVDKKKSHMRQPTKIFPGVIRPGGDTKPPRASSY